MKWGTEWLTEIEASQAFSTHALRRGADYARYDWQLEVEVEAGIASTIARSGRRMQYKATAKVPTLADDFWDDLVARLADSTRATAALLDGEPPDDLGASLLVPPSEIELGCSCQSNDAPCKHAAAVLYLLAEAFDEDPFELLHLRGMARRDLIDRVTSVRRNEIATDEDEGEGETASQQSPDNSVPRLQWNEVLGELPEDWPLPAGAAELPPFPTDPPATAGFTAEGLRTLASDAAHRAFEMLTSLEIEQAPIDATADLARRAAVARNTDRWKHLVQQSGVSAQELTSRAQAWEIAGTDGVEAHVAPAEIVKLTEITTGQPTQWRRTGGGNWVRFAKSRGRWEAVETSEEKPNLTSYEDPV